MPGAAWTIVYSPAGVKEIGKTVVPGPGSYISGAGTGSMGLYLDHRGRYLPVRLLQLGDIQAEVERLVGNRLMDGEQVPVGFGDNSDDILGRGLAAAQPAEVEPDAAAGSPKGEKVWKHALRPAVGEEGSEAGSDSLRPPDLRVLYVDSDDTGTRYKEWRKVILESKTVSYADVPLEGPLSALNWCRHTHRFGGNPRLWFTEFARSKSIASSDRVYHELSTLVDAVYHGGTYDQYNLGCSICIEIICRRVQSIVDAYSNPGRIDFTQARHFVGGGSLEDPIDPALKNYVARKSKDEAEIQNARDKARALTTSAPGAAPAYPPISGAPGPVRPKPKKGKGKTGGGDGG